MMRVLVFIAGLLFGAGVTVSGMVNPSKVLNFMDIAGAWDPTLLFVMGAGLIVTFLGYRWVLARRAPLCAPSFVLPTTTAIDKRLALGAVLFGLGWGLTGFCPGPAVASLAFGNWQAFVFAAAMLAGTVAARLVTRQPATPGTSVRVEG
ncbi:MAG: YeeE/YedE family protein [Alphaproteobacteria bacterium]|nr:YeeE/YedE family protein [Alphaproteobacteria bacterium]